MSRYAQGRSRVAEYLAEHGPSTCAEVRYVIGWARTDSVVHEMLRLEKLGMVERSGLRLGENGRPATAWMSTGYVPPPKAPPPKLSPHEMPRSPGIVERAIAAQPEFVRLWNAGCFNSSSEAQPKH